MRAALQRLGLVLLLPLLALDCLGSLLVGESPRGTLSAKAHHVGSLEPHRYWWWLEPVINLLFFWQRDAQGRRNHCQRAWWSEAAHRGSVWRAWAAQWRAVGAAPTGGRHA